MSAGVGMRLHHVQVGCPSGGEDAARAFYAGVLDIPEVAKPPVLAARSGCWFLVDDVDAVAARVAGAASRSAGTTTFPVSAGSTRVTATATG